jgi:hypothetical protein
MPSTSPSLQALNNRRIRFQGASNTFCAFQVYAKRGGGYEGILRVGKGLDTGTNGDFVRFPLGNAHTAEQFIGQLKYAFSYY